MAPAVGSVAHGSVDALALAEHGFGGVVVEKYYLLFFSKQTFSKEPSVQIEFLLPPKSLRRVLFKPVLYGTIMETNVFNLNVFNLNIQFHCVQDECIQFHSAFSWYAWFRYY